MKYRVVDENSQRVICETDDFKEACDVALVSLCRHPERDYTVVDDEGLVAVAPLPSAGATSPRESCGFQRGAAGACPAGSSAGALDVLAREYE